MSDDIMTHSHAIMTVVRNSHYKNIWIRCKVNANEVNYEKTCLHHPAKVKVTLLRVKGIAAGDWVEERGSAIECGFEASIFSRV